MNAAPTPCESPRRWAAEAVAASVVATAILLVAGAFAIGLHGPLLGGALIAGGLVWLMTAVGLWSAASWAAWLGSAASLATLSLAGVVGLLGGLIVITGDRGLGEPLFVRIDAWASLLLIGIVAAACLVVLAAVTDSRR